MDYKIREIPFNNSFLNLTQNETHCANKAEVQFEQWIDNVNENLNANGAKHVAGNRWRKIFNDGDCCYECHFDLYEPIGKNKFCVLDHVKVISC